MPRYPTLAIATAAAACVAIAMQRDTPLRRWLLPTTPTPAAAAKLTAVLPDVHLVGTTPAQALAAVSSKSGLAVEVDSELRSGLEGSDGRAPATFDLHLTKVTVAEAIDAILQQAGGGMVATPQGERVIIAAADGPRSGLVVRVHDVEDLLPSGRAPPADDRLRNGGQQSPPLPSAGESERDVTAAELASTLVDYVSESPSGGGGNRRWLADVSGVRWRAGRLVVVASPAEQEQVAEVLRQLRRGRAAANR